MSALPTAWQTLMVRVQTEADSALQRNDPFNARDQAILQLAHTLSRIGAQAAWSLAQAEAPGAQQTHWLAIARGYHDLLVKVHAGWTRRPLLGSNGAIPIEANRVTPAPLYVQTTDAAQQWMARLQIDPLRLTAATALAGLNAIPAGVWIAPT